MSKANDILDIFGIWRRKRVKDESSCRIAHVHSVDRESMSMDVETEGRIASLDERHCAGERVFHAAKTKKFLRAATQRAHQ